MSIYSHHLSTLLNTYAIRNAVSFLCYSLIEGLIYNCHQRLRLGDVAAFENRQPVTAAKFINKSSLFILLPGFIRRLELKPNSEQKVENLFVAPPYCQTACCA